MSGEGVVGIQKVVDHGPDSERWNLVFVGDGYQDTELAKYQLEVDKFIMTLQTTPPFDGLFSLINVYRIDVKSNESGAGADDPNDTCQAGFGIPKDTYFEAKYCSSMAPGLPPLDRLLTINSGVAKSVAKDNVGPNVHQVICIVNSVKAGGSGDTIEGVAVVSCTDPNANPEFPTPAEVALHELGHTAFGLADEYDYGEVPLTPGEPPNPNVTFDPKLQAGTKSLWRSLVLPTTPLPSQCNSCGPLSNCISPASPPAPGAVGTYEGALYNKCNVYRPAQICRMYYSKAPFCPVCTEVIRQTLYTFTFRHNNDVDLMVNGDQALQSILDELSAANHHIHIEMMLFFYDPICREILEVLKNRAANGVKVRVMFDGGITENGGYFASATSMKPSSHNSSDVQSLASELHSYGVKVINSYGEDGIRNLMHKIPPEVPSEFRDRQELINDDIIVDYFHHDHRKIIVIDGKVGFIGSLNFGEEYLYHQPLNEDQPASEDHDAAPPNSPTPNDKWEKWHDLIARIKGPAVNDLQRLFAERWLLSSRDPFDSIPLDDDNYFPTNPAAVGPGAVKVLSSGPGLTNEIRREILVLINASTSSVDVENPYFYDDDIVSALKSASQRGVTVRVIEPAKNDCFFCHDAGQERYDDMIEAGIEVYEYRNHFSHCKIATIDKKYTILGSYNFNWRSAYKDLEANIVVDYEDLALQVKEDIFDHDISKSDPITVTDFSMENRNPITFFLEKIEQI